MLHVFVLGDTQPVEVRQKKVENYYPKGLQRMLVQKTGICERCWT